MTHLEQTEDQTDGRRARSAKTRAAIVEALMDLIQGGNLAPTSEDVAQHAGVGHRTVFRHFQDMDSLFEEISTRVETTTFAKVREVEPEGPLQMRVETLVDWRADAYEKVKNFRRATVARQSSSAFIRENRKKWANILRKRLFLFLPELDGRSKAVQSGVEVLLSIEAWEQLRVEQRLSQKAAKAVQVEAVLELLSN